jgi:hypothetical protein
MQEGCGDALLVNGPGPGSGIRLSVLFLRKTLVGFPQPSVE